MKFPIAIHRDPKSDYGVTIPDLPGCFSAGTSIEEALRNAEEAVICHIEGLLLDGESIPRARSIDEHIKNSQFKKATWAVIEVDLSRYANKTERFNVTMPNIVLTQIDRAAIQQGETRSGFLATAALEHIKNIERSSHQ